MVVIFLTSVLLGSSSPDVVPFVPPDASKFSPLLYSVAPYLFSQESGNLKALDLCVALHAMCDPVLHPAAMREACKHLRKKCIEKRITEKAVKDVLFRSTPVQIGSFLLKLDVEPIFMDTFLHMLKYDGGNKAQCNAGAFKIASYLDVGCN